MQTEACPLCSGQIKERPYMYRVKIDAGFIESNVNVCCKLCLDKICAEIGRNCPQKRKEPKAYVWKVPEVKAIEKDLYRQAPKCYVCGKDASGPGKRMCQTCRFTRKRYENRRDRIKNRARKQGIPFDIEYFSVKQYQEWMTKSTNCIICDRTFSDDKQESKRSIDRIIPELGYVKGNIGVICCRCNTVKSHGTAKEHIMIGNYLERVLKTGSIVYLTAKRA